VTEYDFQVEVQGDNLTVARPGSGFRAVYFKPAGRPQLILRQRTETEDHELLARQRTPKRASWGGSYKKPRPRWIDRGSQPKG
jgi:hypothetical protein